MTQRRIFKFRLFVAAESLNAIKARANLLALCRTHLPGRHEIEVVDVFLEPHRVVEDGILMTPTLVKIAPPPIRSIVGTLSQTQSVLDTLGLAARGP
jgi:circadian clock protein KaiB